jgi:hypothetical protein
VLRKILHVGRKNPHTDSIVSTLAYAEALRRQSIENVVAARQAHLWREAHYVLDRFGMHLPVVNKVVRSCAEDVMAAVPIICLADGSACHIGRRNITQEKAGAHPAAAGPALEGE